MNISSIATARAYAIGDPHGMRYEFESIINKIEDDMEKHPVAHAKIIVMGDLIDRGNDSAGVVQAVVDLPKRFPNVEIIAIRGNHDRHIIQITDGNLEYLADWRSDGAGGKCTLRDYGIDPDIASNKISEALTRALPAEHLTMFRNMPLLFDDGHTVFTHAGIRPGVPIADQLEEDLLFIRADFLEYTGSLPRFVVHGHSPRRNPEIRHNRLNVDTGSGYGLTLTCGILSDSSTTNIRFLSVPITHIPCTWKDTPRYAIFNPYESQHAA